VAKQAILQASKKWPNRENPLTGDIGNMIELGSET